MATLFIVMPASLISGEAAEVVRKQRFARRAHGTDGQVELNPLHATSPKSKTTVVNPLLLLDERLDAAPL